MVYLLYAVCLSNVCFLLLSLPPKVKQRAIMSNMPEEDFSEIYGQEDYETEMPAQVCSLNSSLPASFFGLEFLPCISRHVVNRTLMNRDP